MLCVVFELLQATSEGKKKRISAF